MLKSVPSIINPDLLWILAAMGHGDDLVLVDRNFPAWSVAQATVSRRLVHCDGVDTTAAAQAIFALFPLDSFVEAPIRRMEVVGDPSIVLPVHADLKAAADAAEGRDVGMASIERHAFYAAARQAFAVVQTTETRPYGCFLLKKGVIFD
jgi:L-fucose mutarotase